MVYHATGCDSKKWAKWFDNPTGGFGVSHYLLNHLPPLADLATPPNSQNSPLVVLVLAAAESPAPLVPQPGAWKVEAGRKSSPPPEGKPLTVPRVQHACALFFGLGLWGSPVEQVLGMAPASGAENFHSVNGWLWVEGNRWSMVVSCCIHLVCTYPKLPKCLPFFACKHQIEHAALNPSYFRVQERANLCHCAAS